MRKEVFTQYRYHIYTLYLRVQKRNYERLVFFPRGVRYYILGHLNGKIMLRGFELHGNSKDMATIGHSP